MTGASRGGRARRCGSSLRNGAIGLPGAGATGEVGSDVRVVAQGAVCEGVVLRRDVTRLQVELLLDGEPVVGWFEAAAVLRAASPRGGRPALRVHRGDAPTDG